ncbi:MAG: response regulator [Planctomycetota bacterium]|jgi:DNA-binding response OmpR family regulator|nr:response regulator [Planctomycetota bacterium]
MSKRIVLILEECRILREEWRSWLMADGFHVLSTSDQRVALSWVKRFRPAFVIANTRLAPIDGFQFCRLLRNHRDTQSIPVALVSEDWEKRGRVRAELSGAVAVLQSGLNRHHFLDEIYDHLLIEEETTGTARERRTFLSSLVG